jgi:hypothetical protein
MRTIDAVWVSLVAGRLERRGLSAADLLQRAEIKPYVLHQKSARIPYYQHAALLDLSAKRRRTGASASTSPQTKAILATMDCWPIRRLAARLLAKRSRSWSGIFTSSTKPSM